MAVIFRWSLALMIGLGLAFTVLFVADPLRAQTMQCESLDRVIELLTEKYDERLVGTGNGPSGVRIFVFAHQEGATWTAIAVLPDGQACMVASGTNWQPAPPVPTGEDI